MKIRSYYLPILLIVAIVFISGCVSQEPPTATTTEPATEAAAPTAEPTTETATTPEIQTQQPEELELDVNCDAYADKLDSCTRYKCQPLDPFTGEPITGTDFVIEILGVIDGKCEQTQLLPNDGKIECKYTESMRKAVAQYARDVAAAESTGTEVEADSSGETVTKYTIDGKEVTDPFQEAMDSGQCVVSGYN